MFLLNYYVYPTTPKITSTMASQPVQVFFHSFEFNPCTARGLDKLIIVVTFDGTYTIEMSQLEDGWSQKHHIRDIPYIPKSMFQMMSIAGGRPPSRIIAMIQQICSETLQEENMDKLRSDLANANETIHQMRAQLTRARESFVQTQTKLDEIQDKNTELLDTLVDQLQKIGQLEETNQELVQKVKSIEEQTLDTMLESAFDDLHM
jgi:hypothetical protein